MEDSFSFTEMEDSFCFTEMEDSFCLVPMSITSFYHLVEVCFVSSSLLMSE